MYTFNWKFRLLILLLLAIGGVSYWFWSRSGGDEAAVRSMLRDFCHDASKPRGEGNLAGAGKILRIKGYFAPECQFRFHQRYVSRPLSPEVIAEELGRARGLLSHFTVRLDDLEVVVEPPDRATAYFTAVGEGAANNGEEFSEAQDLFCQLERIDGKWRFVRISVHDIIER